MEKLIPIINKLQDVFNAIAADPIGLPQIVVVGAQSAGKSSVLENIVGRDFLPRGSGIVTRRPLVMQLIHVPSGGKGGAHDEWGEFLHKPTEQFYDFEEIRKEIARETDRLTGKNKGISDRSINLKIFSPHVVNLTMVDLPGLTRIPIGDQPADIEKQIRRMIRSFTERPNAIILAVTAANTDIATSDALQMAREVDPHGERTIGVITKIDLMDKGTDALDLLSGRTFPLRLGYVGVINRSQQDIQQGKSIRDALESESDYFMSHPSYRAIAARCGTKFLSQNLNKILLNHIRKSIPELKSKINKMVSKYQTEMLTYGDPMYEGKNSQGAMLLQIITRFSNDYRNAIDGQKTDVSTHELYGGARISYIFNDVFGRCLSNVDPKDSLTMNDIRTAIRNTSGPRSALFVPESAFEMLVKDQIAALEEPCLQCVELVFQELQRIVNQLESKELLRFSNLRSRVVDVVNGLLVKCRQPTKTMISNLIACESAFININHPDFIGGGNASSQLFERLAQSHAYDQQQQQQESWGSNGARIEPPPQQQQQQMQQPQQQQNIPQQVVRQTAQAASEGTFFSHVFGAKGGPPQQQQQQRQTAQQSIRQQPQQQQQMPPQQQQRPKALPAQPQRNQGYGGFSSFSDDHQAGDRTVRLDSIPQMIRATTKPTEKEAFETELIVKLLVSYFGVVRKNILDMVPKSIMHFLVNQSRENIHHELVQNLYHPDLFDELLEESGATAERRRACKAMLDILTKAQNILSEIRDQHV